MSLWNWFRSHLDPLAHTRPGYPDPNHATWSPPKGKPVDGRWSVIVRNSFEVPIPWHYGTYYYQSKGWALHNPRDQSDLSAFVKKLAFALPDFLWPDKKPNDPYHRLTICLDVRLLDFSPARFDDPAVIRAISGFVQDSWQRFTKTPMGDGTGQLRRQIVDYPFEYETVGGLTFGLCWYRFPWMLNWPSIDMLHPVPDAKDLKEALSSLGDLASLCVPNMTLLEGASLPPAPPIERRRPSFERRLDGSNLDEVISSLDDVLDPIHDLALSVFQKCLDQLAGQACPSYEDNKRIASMVLERIDRYGFRLFMERKGELVRVRVDAKPAHSSLKSNPEGPTAKAGLFTIRGSYDASTGTGKPLSDVATFPHLIAARDLEQAERFWRVRMDELQQPE